jgi:tetratricopeptide (TPR) repeat protein
MSKLKVVIKFDSTEERDEFLIKLLNIDTLLNQAKLKKKERERILEGLNNFIKMIEPPRKGNPYYKLYNTFYYGYVGDVGYEPKPWTQAGVFLNGIRSIYMVYQYKYIKGIWLCIEFRNNNIGREKYYWILEYIPKEKLGENIPLPDKIKYRKRLARVLEVLNGYNPERYADELFSILLDVKEKMPSAFSKKYIYLWEDLALLFDSMDRFDKCLECYKNLAELMPNSSDPYLNMGVFCADRGLIKEAIEYYKKGLEINPNDEYIYYNLSSLLLYQGRQDKALKEINNAIIENPERGINFKLKGDIHFSKHQYHQAIQCYEWALNLFDEEWEESARECKELLAEAYLRIGEKEKADEIKKSLNKK